MITIYTLLIFGALIIAAFFTSSEMAMTSLNWIKLKSLIDRGDSRAKKVEKLLGSEGSFLGATLVGTNIAIVVASVLTTRICTEYFGVQYAPLATTLILVPLTLIFSEIVPKIIARQYATELALNCARPLDNVSRMFYPVIVAVNWIAGVLLLPFGKHKKHGDVNFTKTDLKLMLAHGHAAGEVEADEVELIHKVLDFGAIKVEKIMVPLYRVSSIAVDDTVDNLKRLVDLTGFSRVPIYKEKKSLIEGIINIYDILFMPDEVDGSAPIGDFVREPVYVSRKDGLDIALARLRHAEQPMGIVMDEEEKVVGLVTIEDILEELVGEIEDTGVNI